MLELLRGRPTGRLVVSLPPQLKEAAVQMAMDGDQNTSQLVRHLLAAEVGRRIKIVEEAHREIEERVGKNRLLELARQRRQTAS